MTICDICQKKINKDYIYTLKSNFYNGIDWELCRECAEILSEKIENIKLDMQTLT